MIEFGQECIIEGEPLTGWFGIRPESAVSLSCSKFDTVEHVVSPPANEIDAFSTTGERPSQPEKPPGSRGSRQVRAEIRLVMINDAPVSSSWRLETAGGGSASPGERLVRSGKSSVRTGKRLESPDEPLERTGGSPVGAGE